MISSGFEIEIFENTPPPQEKEYCPMSFRGKMRGREGKKEGNTKQKRTKGDK
jgi:hypothetical protein